MILLLIALIFSYFVVKSIVFDDFGGMDAGSLFFGILFFCVIGAISIFVLGGIAVGIGLLFEQKDYFVQSNSIASLRDGTAINGSFILGSGNIKSTPYYYFYTKLSDGSFKFDSVDATQTRIYQDENKNPRIDMYDYTFVNPVWWLIALPSINEEYKLHVPENTIVQKYILNMGQS